MEDQSIVQNIAKAMGGKNLGWYRRKEFDRFIDASIHSVWVTTRPGVPNDLIMIYPEGKIAFINETIFHEKYEKARSSISL